MTKKQKRDSDRLQAWKLLCTCISSIPVVVDNSGPDENPEYAAWAYDHYVNRATELLRKGRLVDAWDLVISGLEGIRPASIARTWVDDFLQARVLLGWTYSRAENYMFGGELDINCVGVAWSIE